MIGILDPIAKCSLPPLYCCKVDSMVYSNSTLHPTLVIQTLCKPWNNVSGSSEGSKWKLRVGKTTWYSEYVTTPVNGMNHCSFHSGRDPMQSTCPQMGDWSPEWPIQYWGVCISLCSWQVGHLPWTTTRSRFCDWELMFWGTCITSIPAQIATSFICPSCQP